jgi:hypothetical protein
MIEYPSWYASIGLQSRNGENPMKISERASHLESKITRCPYVLRQQPPARLNKEWG